MRLFSPPEVNSPNLAPLTMPSHSLNHRILLSNTQTILLIISMTIVVLALMALLGYLFYRKYYRSGALPLTDEELEEQELEAQRELRLENEKEWEAKRFEKLRYCGNSDYYSWQLIKKVKIIEGMS
jgi:hypothetical protein